MTDREKLIELLSDSPHLDTLDGDYSDAAEHLINNGVTINSGWISVNDGLPEIDTDVLCYSDKWGGYRFVGWINPITGRWRDNTGEAHIGTVTHWMPMPEPPNKEDKT